MAISGLLAATGIGMWGAAIVSGGLGFVGSVGGDLIESNGDWSSVNWGKAVVLGIVNFWTWCMGRSRLSKFVSFRKKFVKKQRRS